MPLARISVPTHLSAERVQALADAVHGGLVATCNVPVDDHFQLITRFAPDAMIINPTFPDVHRTADASIVEIHFLRGRTDAQKAALYRHVADAAMRGGFAGDDIFIALVENGPMDWSMGRGEPFSASHVQAAAHA